jgi:hypothetical protein
MLASTIFCMIFMIHQETHFENKNEANKKMFKLSLNRNGM